MIEFNIGILGGPPIIETTSSTQLAGSRSLCSGDSIRMVTFIVWEPSYSEGKWCGIRGNLSRSEIIFHHMKVEDTFRQSTMPYYSPILFLSLDQMS
jgi:hypothetical protein